MSASRTSVPCEISTCPFATVSPSCSSYSTSSAWNTIGALRSARFCPPTENCAATGAAAARHASSAAPSASSRRPRQPRLAGGGKPVMRRIRTGRSTLKKRPGSGKGAYSANISASLVSSVLKVKQHRHAEDHADPGWGPGGQQNRDLVRQPEREHDVRQEVEEEPDRDAADQQHDGAAAALHAQAERRRDQHHRAEQKRPRQHHVEMQAVALCRKAGLFE